MSIFSKWFGSKDTEEQKDEIAEEVCSNDVEQDEIMPDPQNVPEAMRYVVLKWGADYLKNRSLLNILNDFQVLKDIPAAKHILLNMQSNGYIEKIALSTNWSLDARAIATRYSTEFGAKEDIVIYLVECLGYGLKYTTEEPRICKEEEAPLPQFTNPASQEVKFAPQQNKHQTNNITPPQPAPQKQTPQPVPIGPYDPKHDLENYRYPSLDLLTDYNSNDTIISLKSILSSKDYQYTSMLLPCAIGQNENGEVMMFDLADNPHIMVSGSSGMGVSIFFNTLITSLLYKKHPAEIKFVMIDPKKIEFSLYQPLEKHFLASIPNNEPIITDMLNVSDTFLALSREIDSRQELLRKASIRSIKDYNKKFCDRKLNINEGHRYLPYIILLVDEYDELVRSCGRSMESSLEKITKMGRATGICVILTILRPVGTVISSAIKTNMLGRISFRVSSANDSRNILGHSGAEKLQRPGDLIYSDGINIVNGRCAYMELSEVERINDYIKNQLGYISPYGLPDPNMEEYEEPHVDMQHLDPLFEDSARLIVINQSGSTSLIQRKFAIGYNRANRLMDQLEKAGVVGAAFGSKPREVMIQDENSLNNLLAFLR